MAKHSIYLRDDLEPILQTLLEIFKDENPGRESSVSAVFACALFEQAIRREGERIKTDGPTPDNKRFANRLAQALKDGGYIKDFVSPFPNA